MVFDRRTLQRHRPLPNSIRSLESGCKGERWARLEDCSAEMMAAWTAAGSPEGPNRGSRRGHQVCLIDPTSGEVVRTFDTMSDAVHAMRTSHKQIHTSFQKQAVYMGFRWTVV